jgi:hypothetical protein
VVRAAQEAGVWVFGGGVENPRASIVATDGMVTDGPYPETKALIGGFAIVDVPSREEALEWAAKFAAACRCGQAVREILSDTLVRSQETRPGQSNTCLRLLQTERPEVPIAGKQQSRVRPLEATGPHRPERRAEGLQLLLSMR